MLVFHRAVFGHKVVDCVSGLLEVGTAIEELLIVMYIQLSGVELREAALHLLEASADACVVGEAEQGVVLLDWRSVADAVFEALGVPVDELEGFALTEEFDVAVDVGEGDFASHDEAHREVSTAQRI